LSARRRRTLSSAASSAAAATAATTPALTFLRLAIRLIALLRRGVIRSAFSRGVIGLFVIGRGGAIVVGDWAACRWAVHRYGGLSTGEWTNGDGGKIPGIAAG